VGRRRGYTEWIGKANERTTCYVPRAGKSVERTSGMSPRPLRGHLGMALEEGQTSREWRREAMRKARWEQRVEALRVQP